MPWLVLKNFVIYWTLFKYCLPCAFHWQTWCEDTSDPIIWQPTSELLESRVLTCTSLRIWSIHCQELATSIAILISLPCTINTNCCRLLLVQLLSPLFSYSCQIPLIRMLFGTKGNWAIDGVSARPHLSSRWWWQFQGLYLSSCCYAYHSPPQKWSGQDSKTCEGQIQNSE